VIVVAVVGGVASLAREGEGEREGKRKERKEDAQVLAAPR
jgi:hypothetical protein